MATSTRRTTATPGPSSRGPAGGATLPAYERPAFSLNPAGQRALANLLQRHPTKRFEESITSAQQELLSVVGDIYEKFNEKKQAVSKRRERFDNGREDDEDELKAMEADVEKLQEKATQMHERMEEQMRKLIDAKAGVGQMREAVNAAEQDARANASTQASTQQGRALRNRRVDQDSDEEDEDDEVADFTPTDPAGGTQPLTAPKDVFKKRLETELLRYQNKSLTERYAETNEYGIYKRVLHDGLYPGDEVELAPPSQWFDEGGRPAPGVTLRTQNEDDSDDDIAVERTVISTKCPLTLREFEVPWTSKKCPHTFEKTAIEGMIHESARKEVQCPASGCQLRLTKNDLHKDPVITRRIKRLQESRRAAEEDDDDDREPNGTQRRGHVIDSDAVDIDELDDEPPVRMKPEPKSSRLSAAPQQATVPPRPSQVIDMGSSDDEDEDEDMED